MPKFFYLVSYVTFILIGLFFASSYMGGFFAKDWKSDLLMRTEGNSQGWGVIFNGIFFVLLLIFTGIVIYFLELDIKNKFIIIGLLSCVSILWFFLLTHYYAPGTNYNKNSFSVINYALYVLYWVIPITIVATNIIVINGKITNFLAVFFFIGIVFSGASYLYIFKTLSTANSLYVNTQVVQDKVIDFKIKVPAYYKLSERKSNFPITHFNQAAGDAYFRILLSDSDGVYDYYKQRFAVPIKFNLKIYSQDKKIDLCTNFDNHGEKEGISDVEEFNENGFAFCEREIITQKSEKSDTRNYYQLNAWHADKKVFVVSDYSYYPANDKGDYVKNNAKSLIIESINSLEYDSLKLNERIAKINQQSDRE